ncbi:MAG: DUF86 domain-containing protein [Cyclobacteriaceae bacterium]
MTDRGKKYLSDIVLAIALIEEFIAAMNTFEKYNSDLKTQSAVERQLSILGEAVNQFLKESPDESLIHAKQIIGFRNRLVHAYDSIDNSIVWVILKKYLNPLKSEVLQKMESK